MSPEMGDWVPAVTSASLNLQVTVASEIGAGFALLLLSGLVANGRPYSQQVGLLEQFSSGFFSKLILSVLGVCYLEKLTLPWSRQSWCNLTLICYHEEAHKNKNCLSSHHT